MFDIEQFLKPLPVKNGVNPSCLYLTEGDWETVFDFFCHSFSHISKEECRRRFETGDVKFEDGTIVTTSTHFKKNIKIYYYRELASEIKIPFEEKVIFENERFLVVDKPHFLPVAPSGEYLHETLIVRLRKNLKLNELELCHRLDRETAGLVLVTKEAKYRANYHKLFSDRNITKVYHAVSKTPVDFSKFPQIKKSQLVKSKPFFLMEESKESKSFNSESKIEILKTEGEKTLYKLTPKTGKKHQLRVHMASIGFPIKNDSFYPKLLNREIGSFKEPLQLLAKSLHFQDPYDEKYYDFYSRYKLKLDR